MDPFEAFLDEIETYARERGISASTVVQTAVNSSGATFARWKAGSASCSVRTMARVRAYIAANPPSPSTPAATAE